MTLAIAASADPAPPARVWAVLCYRAGENAQILALAEALGLPYEVKRLAYRRFGQAIDVWRGAKLLGIDQRRSSALTPPWPDLVISAAMRNEPVCRWIRKQSGGRTRYVHIGKPWGRLATFDLVITVPEYPVPDDRLNVLKNTFSLHRVSRARLAEQARIWAPRVEHLPRPYVTVLVGGYSGAYAFDREKAARLGREASALARRQGGSLLVTTSARTSRAAADALVQAIDVPSQVFRWQAATPENPYLGYLGLADAVVVTCESATMLAEACATGKPVHMFDLGRDDPVRGSSWRETLRRYWQRCNYDRLRALLYRQGMLRFAPRKITRDISRVHDLVLRSGWAGWLGQNRTTHALQPPPDELPRTVARVRSLLGISAEAGAPALATPGIARKARRRA